MCSMKQLEVRVWPHSRAFPSAIMRDFEPGGELA